MAAGWSTPSSSSSSGKPAGAKPRLRPICGGIAIGVVIGVLYCFSMWYFAPALGIGARAASVAAFDGISTLCSTAPCNESAVEEDGDGRVLPWERKQAEWLLALWEASPMLNLRFRYDPLVREARRQLSNMSMLQGPHLEDCAAKAEEYRRLDGRDREGRRPAWSLWKGEIGKINRAEAVELEDIASEEFLGDSTGLVWGPYPPWVEGADEDNLPMTRRAQRDLWLLQHPRNCSADDVRFLVASWTNNPKHGFGAQIHHMQGMFAVAITDKRVLVTHDFAFGKHQGCRGADHNRWSCYFIPETTPECRRRAYKLMEDPRAIAEGRILIDRDIPPHWDIWMGQPSLLWGAPWDHAQPTTEIEGHLLLKHNTANVRWWRAQAIRYLMRYPSQYTCMLMNKARHEAFGVRAAADVVRSAIQTWTDRTEEADMDKWVWKGQKPWVPRPLVSIHVRIGDKGWEMKMVDFPAYMDLANRLRNRFPHVRDVWLSTEMQEVIDASKEYKGWNFYYTHIARQTGGTSMAAYLDSLGTEKATGMSVVNFLMASDADYFVGALGSTWCYLIDGMRSTGGKQMAGYLSVNIDRHWKKKRRKRL